MVALLSVLSSLETLHLQFETHQFRLDRETRRLPPVGRSVIPALYEFRFKGVTHYLEDLVTRIDTPQLDHMRITFLFQLDYDCPRLAQFIDYTPKLRARDEAHAQFDESVASVASVTPRYRKSNFSFRFDDLLINLSSKKPEWQLMHIKRFCNSSLQLLSMAEDLYIEHEYSDLVWENDFIENIRWSGHFLPFTAVKNLYLSEKFAPGIAAALEELVEDELTEVLPSLQNIFVEGLEPSGPFWENVGQFVTERELSARPVAISDWDKDSNMESM
jgi:hypothetical protein